jgi:hypothetical protein
MGDLLGLHNDAVLSDCGRYRYLLRREWGGAPPLGWIMLNPSTADADQDDPTIRRCIGFAHRNGYGGIRVVNLFALRATDPSELLAADNPIGDLYDPWLLLRICTDVVAAWGAVKPALSPRAREVVDMRPVQGRLLCLGTTKHGYPRHPLYLRADQPLVEYVAPPDAQTGARQHHQEDRSG